MPEFPTMTRIIMNNIKTYSDVIKIPTFEERFLFLKVNGQVCNATFSGHRYLNQNLYRSPEWKRFRRKIIIRDNGSDLACDDRIISGSIIIHHINPLSMEDILYMRPCVFDEENAICTSARTHNAIHYGDESLIMKDYVPREKDDTCLWR